MVDQHTGAGSEGGAGHPASTDAPMGRVHAHARTPETDRLADEWIAANPVSEPTTVREIAREAFAAGRVSRWRELTLPLMGAVRLLAEAGRMFRSYEAHHQAKVDEGRSDHGHAPAGAVEKVKRNADIAERIEEFLLIDSTPRDTLTGLALSLVQDIDALIGNSEGVAGLHMNGNVAPWGSLTEGGEFGAWLGSFDRLRDALDEAFPPAGIAGRHHADAESTARVEERLFPTAGLDPEVVDALRQTHDGAGPTPVDPFALTTADPKFNPTMPVTVNGFMFMPVRRA